MNKVQNRDSSIELLRIIMTLGVIILHYNNPLSGKALLYASGFNRVTILFFESIFIGAVNIFILITGYHMYKNNKRSLSKPIKLLVQVMTFSLIFYIFTVIMGKADLSLNHILWSLIPANYFVILYIALYFVSPYINLIISQLNLIYVKKMLIILICVFSIYPTLVDLFYEITGKEVMGLSTIGAYGSQYGYTIVNFLLMYIIGAVIKKHEDFYKTYSNNCQLKITLYIICLLALTFWGGFYDYNNFGKSMCVCAWEYCNPIVILLSIITFAFFLNHKIKSNKIINGLAKASFTVYLTHGYFLGKINVENYINKNVGVMLLHIIISVTAIYLICWIIYIIYSRVTDPLFKLLERAFPFLTKDVINFKGSENE